MVGQLQKRQIKACEKHNAQDAQLWSAKRVLCRGPTMHVQDLWRKPGDAPFVLLEMVTLHDGS